MATIVKLQAPSAPATERGRVVCLLLLALVTRLPFLSNAPAEPDSVRFLMGVWRWVRVGPQVGLAASVHGAIYGDFLSPGYYALAAGLVRLLHVPASHYALLLNVLSLIAALAAAPLLYGVLRLWVEPNAATVATALFLIAPGFWWLGLEPHPQGLAIAFFLGAALLASRSVNARGLALTALVLWLALLMRADFILYAGALVPLLLRAEGAPWTRRALRHALARTTAVAGAAGVAFLLARRVLLARPWGMLASETNAISGGYMHHGTQLLGQLGYVVRQLLPFPFAVGPWVFLWTLAGIALWLRQRRGRWPQAALPLLFALAWSLPGAIFWFLIQGNTARHVVLLALPWLGLAAAGWFTLGVKRWVWTAAAVAVALNFLTFPPQTDLNMMPTPNVPMTLRPVRLKQALAQDESRRLEATAYRMGSSAGPLCYFGTETDILIEWDLVQRYPATLTETDVATAPTFTGLPRPAPPLRFWEAYNAQQYLEERPGCAVNKSLEITSSRSRLLDNPWTDSLRRLRHRWLP